jgi:hypothetical protein
MCLIMLRMRFDNPVHVLMLLNRGPCDAQQVHERFRKAALSLLWGFKDAVLAVLYTPVQVS